MATRKPRRAAKQEPIAQPTPEARLEALEQKLVEVGRLIDPDLGGLSAAADGLLGAISFSAPLSVDDMGSVYKQLRPFAPPHLTLEVYWTDGRHVHIRAHHLGRQVFDRVASVICS